MVSICTFRSFRQLCSYISNENSTKNKTLIIKKYLSTCNNTDVHLIITVLLCSVNKCVYNLNDKQLIKHFSKIFNHDINEMISDLEQGDVSETIKQFFEKSNTRKPISKSIMLLIDVYNFLKHLSTLTKEKDQQSFLKDIVGVSTSNDLKCFILLIKNDLKIRAGAKCILDALHPHAYETFKMSQNLNNVIHGVLNKSIQTVSITPFIPIKPMLADACKSITDAFKKFPNGMYVEIKYDGERVQIHKNGDIIKYYSRNLKPVLEHKIESFNKIINQAFTNCDTIILDAELILIDTVTSTPLPFGSLGIHKKKLYQNATECVFIFDCMLYNNQILINMPLYKRKEILLNNMTEIKDKIMFSESKRINTLEELNDILTSTIDEGLEGLVVKKFDEEYKPGKRHWLKIKKDYLECGFMVDSADLVVLGAYYGKGIKGGIMSIFLMGCYDDITNKWYTVTKCSGHDDDTLKQLQTQLKMIKISKNESKIPNWLVIHKNYYPDFITLNPYESQIWEIRGAEFSASPTHTANGISIRFPRCIKIRTDKDWTSSTKLSELQTLYNTSKK
ncbi:DNA ligase-like protein [Eptesipox virus]|uniref:DNA ligase n=1 Tax=Eptesipox virus TaxID=1329402 RepID=A0A220T6K6_9POXV|nr:DNA ligase-like protein [Eptesipox virus]ASK51349.1 DNA ligase-like protein [Eptesipox virus]WAH71107.1 DNA ligase-like protein [Eptesipox virus]